MLLLEHQKRASVDVEARRAQEDVAKVRDQLAECVTAKHQIVQELGALKLISLEKTEALQEATAQLLGAKQENESLRQKLLELRRVPVSDVDTHITTSNRSREEGVAAEALHQQEKDALVQRLSRCQETLAGVNAAVANLQEEKSSLLEKLDEWVAVAGTRKQELEELKANQGAMIIELEEKVAFVTTAAGKLEKDLVVSREAESRSATNAVESEALLSKLRMEYSEVKAALEVSEADLRRSRAQLRELQEEQVSLSGAFARLQSDYERESDEVQVWKARHSQIGSELQHCLAQLKNSESAEAAVRAAADSLRAEYENEHAELVDLKVKESRAAEENASLTAELEKTIDDLTAITSAEAKAKEQVEALTDALQQVTAEADEAKKSVAQYKEEAVKAKADAEQAKAALSTCDRRLQAAVKELEAARAAETLALSECRSLRDKLKDGGEVKMFGDDQAGGEEVSISKEDFEALKKQMVEVDDLARKKVDAAVAQVGAAQAAEREMLTRLHAALADLDISREAAGVALKRAEKAEEAKWKIEGELRKYRSGNEQRRKNAEHSRELGVGTGTPYLNVDRSDVESARGSSALFNPGSAPESGEVVVGAGRTAGISERQSESLGQFLNMVITQEKQVSHVVSDTQTSGPELTVPATKRKKTFQAAIKAVFARSRTRAKG